MIRAKFVAYRSNRLEVIQILVNFVFSSAAILDFEKWRFWHFRCLEVVKTKLPAKFGENRTNGSGVIQFFVHFKAAILDYECPDFESTGFFGVRSR